MNLDSIIIGLRQSLRDKSYIVGSFAKYLITQDELYLRQNKIIEVIVCSNDFNINNFYNNLIKHITINKEIKNTEYRYTILSGFYIIDFHIKESIEEYLLKQEFTIDNVIYDILKDEPFDPSNSIQDLLEYKLNSLSSNWTISTIIGFAVNVGNNEKFTINKEDAEKLKDIKLNETKLSPFKNNLDLMKEVLLSNYPGNSIKFIFSFSDGKEWFFNQLINLILDMNIQMSENISLENIEKKLDTINIYNEFFLYDKTTGESTQERTHRITTNLKILTDTPNIQIEIPYIDHVASIMSLFEEPSLEDDIEIKNQWEDAASVSLFYDCGPTGCPPCDPTKCSPKCCCCTATDIVSKINVSCHKQAILSCNASGDGPGPLPCNPAIPGSCFTDSFMMEACQLAKSGIGNPIACSQIENQSWWKLPSIYSPCSCECQAGYELPSNDCSLTCVTCQKFCQSVVTIEGHDCHYTGTITPGQNCCGTNEETGFTSSCNCLDHTPIKLRLSRPECLCCKDGLSPCIDDPLDLKCINSLPEHCFNIPIQKCLPGQDCNDPSRCNREIGLNVCGHTIIISPGTKPSMICCSDVGFGCECPENPCEADYCCGPNCPGSEVCVNGQLLYPPGAEGLRQAQDDVWCNCWTERAGISELTSGCTHCCCPEVESEPGNPNYPCDMLDLSNSYHQQLLQDGICCECSSEQPFRNDCCNCCLLFPDGVKDPVTGECGFTTSICRHEIDIQVENIFKSCVNGEIPETPIPPFECISSICPSDDEIIENENCSSFRHPASVILNNGIGLIVYEEQDENNVSVIKIKQFKTSVSNKLLPNREFNFGRLEHYSKWSNNRAKLYYYEPISNLITPTNNTVNIDNPSTWLDGIVFRTGPLSNKCFPIDTIGTDEIGNYVNIIISSTESFTRPWQSNDDEYNIKWFFFDFEDTGLIGDATDTQTQGKDYIINDHTVVDAILQLPPHIYNGKKVPSAYPSIAIAPNYSNHLENSHFVYLVYQALEDTKWNVYLRQIRLSEYYHSELSSAIVSLQSINVNYLTYKIICKTDSCSQVHNNFLVKRSIVLEVLLLDGRPVFNSGYEGNWPALCPGQESSAFPKNRVFIEFVHSVTTDKCPDQFVIDEMFYDWQTGQSYTVPVQSNMPNSQLFNLLSVPGDSPVPLGQFSEPMIIGDINIYSSFVGSIYYDNPSSSTWSTVNQGEFDLLSEFKGINIDKPILLTAGERGHCTRPKVKVNYRNDVFVVYESTENDLVNIKIIGTENPQNSLPNGYLDGKNIDSNLIYFYTPSDFNYRKEITTQHANKHPDIYIDLNDVIHMTYQSNKDDRWEIYYANSLDNWNPVRITNMHGKSLKPSITGTEDGSVFIAWHDNRHENYEIYLAYNIKDRIIPLFQQNAYLSSIRNDGWTHSNNIVPISITNFSDQTKCYSDFYVNFYYDRLLENFAFSVPYDKFPFAFDLPGLQSDKIHTQFQGLSGWNVSKTYIRDTDPPFDILFQTFLVTSPEIDTGLIDSIMSEVNLPVLHASCQLEFMQLRASNIKNDENSQWTDPIDISSETGTISVLPFDIAGQYQQVKIQFTCEVLKSTYSILDSSDDADLYRSTKELFNDNSTIRIGNDGSDIYDGLFRFQIDLPKDTSIVDSYLSFVSKTTSSNNSKLLVQLINQSDAQPFENSINVQVPVNSSRSDTYSVNGSSVVGAHEDSEIYIGRHPTNGLYTSYLRYLLNIPKSSTIISSNLLVYPVTVGSDNPHSHSNNLRTLIYLLDDNNVLEFPAKDDTLITIPISGSIDDVHAVLGFKFTNNDLLSVNVFNTSTLQLQGIVNLWPVTDAYNRTNIYLRFDASQLQPITPIASATLKLFNLSNQNISYTTNRVYAPGTNGSHCPDFSFEPVSGFINYLQGNKGYPLDIGIHALPIVSGTTLIFDVTEIVNQYIQVITGSTDQYIGFKVASNTPNQTGSFGSFENGLPAILEIDTQHTIFPSFGFSPVSWAPPSDWIALDQESSPDISSLIQEWLNRQNDGYTSGNYIGFAILDDGSDHWRTIASFDHSTHNSILSVTYSPIYPPATIGGVVWNSTNWISDETVQTTDISSLVQRYIDMDDYNPEQHIGFLLKDNLSNDIFEVTSYDDSPSDSATLTVFYSETIFDFTIVSQTPPRLCLSSNSSVSGSLDITPSIRIDKEGNETTEIPLPIDYIPNNTYFTKTFAMDEFGSNIDLGDPKTSVSCDKCSRQQLSWSSVSCSVDIRIESPDRKYYHVWVNFYSDINRNNRILQINSINNSQCFTIGNDIPAQQTITNQGFDVLGELNVMLWPQMSGTTGLLCGINYYIDILLCSNGNCQFSDFEIVKQETWKCACDSKRWGDDADNAPINLREMIRWRSSAFGFSDTRMTDTISNNFNPVIQTKRDGTGIIIYETNRGDGLSIYELYASAFSVRPSYNMYSSSTQFILSPIHQVYHRSDIPICHGHPCIVGQNLKETIKGKNATLSVDQFDNIFLSAEIPYNQNQCNEFRSNRMQKVIVHRCGVDSSDLYAVSDTDVEQPCNQSELLSKGHIESSDPLFNSVINSLRIDKKDVRYHITRQNYAIPVVDKCNVKLIVVGTPECVAIRIRNGTNVWSSWIPFSPQTGENTMEIPWSLSPGSGLKNIYFQISTYTGLTSNSSMLAIADYSPVSYAIRFFRSLTDNSDLNNEEIWVDSNELVKNDGLPVASISVINVQEGTSGDNAEIIYNNQGYIFVEISVPEKETETLTFDVIQQGGNDQYNLPTIKSIRNGQLVYRGKFIIETDGINRAKDGLSFVVPNISSCETYEYPDNQSIFTPDIYNVYQQKKTDSDVWEPDRDKYGLIQYQVKIRPDEDPYFIFGDPNYEL